LNLKDEKGIALPLVIVVVLALSLLGVILFNYNVHETTQVARDEDNLKAHYIARSGAHALASYLVQNQDLAQELRDHMYMTESHYLETFSKEVELGGGQYQVKAEYIGETSDGVGEIHITSIGEYSNARQSIGLTIKIQGITSPVISRRVEGNPVPSLNIEGGNFLYIGEKEDLDPDTINTLNDDVLEEGYEVLFGSHDFDEVILPWEDPKFEMFYGDDPRKNWVFAQDEDENDDNYYDESEELIITENERIRYDIEEKHGREYMENSGGLTIEAGGEGNHILLYADNIEMKTAPITVRIADNNVVAIVVDDEIELDAPPGQDPAFVLEALDGCEEGGHLLLYLKTFDLKGNTEVEVNDSQVHLNMYVYEGGEVDLGGTPSFKGAIYAPDADHIIAGNTIIEGWIIANEIVFRGGSGQSEQHPSDIVYHNVKMFETSMNLETVNIDTWHNTD